jgi:hypothetical protein
MPRKMARQTLERHAGACYAGSRHYLGSGLLGSPENRYNLPHFRVHPGNPGLNVQSGNKLSGRSHCRRGAYPCTRPPRKVAPAGWPSVGFFHPLIRVMAVMSPTVHFRGRTLPTLPLGRRRNAAGPTHTARTPVPWGVGPLARLECASRCVPWHRVIFLNDSFDFAGAGCRIRTNGLRFTKLPNVRQR